MSSLFGETLERLCSTLRCCFGIESKRMIRLLPLGAAAYLLFAPILVTANDQSFDSWLNDLRKEALARGVSAETFDAALKGVEPLERVVELDRRQPEFTRTFASYMSLAISQKRIERAQTLMRQHKDLLDKIHDQYGVQPRFLVAFWGLESNFGDHTGGFSVIAALATLAYDERRSEFFRNELLLALQILEEDHIAPDAMNGSWAGAMGQLQFMPSTFTGYAIDQDGDGKQDIWQNLPDIFGSAANYLGQVGWRGDETWGREVQLPERFNWDLTGLGTRLPLQEWDRLGVRRADGSPLPVVDMEGSIVLPSGHKGPAFLVYKNYRTIMIWNRSILYALAVGHLADRIVGLGPLENPGNSEEKGLSRYDVKEMQVLLNEAGFDTGNPDGIFGRQSRQALKSYQRHIGAPADGYPTKELLQALKSQSVDSNS
ncbi:MAG: lytic murein transglycosylase [Pseudomonadota bacterium]